MTVRTLRPAPAHVVEAGQELVDAIVGAVDTSRSDEVERVRSALEFLNLDDLFRLELRLSGVPSVCDGECWMGVA